MRYLANSQNLILKLWRTVAIFLIAKLCSQTVVGIVPPGGREALWLRNYDYKNMVKNDVYLWKRHNISRILCAVECTADTSCASHFYNENVKTCIAHSRVLIATDMTSSSGYEFYYHRPVYCVDEFYYEPSVNLCFKVFTDRKTALAARQACGTYSGYLVIIDTQDKRNVLTSHPTFDKGEASYYIDGTDAEVDGVFKYSDGRLVPASFWMTGEPNANDGVETCIQMFGFSPNDWMDYDCSTSYPYICEIRQ